VCFGSASGPCLGAIVLSDVHMKGPLDAKPAKPCLSPTCSLCEADSLADISSLEPRWKPPTGPWNSMEGDGPDGRQAKITNGWKSDCNAATA